jgi:hypothetical protein
VSGLPSREGHFLEGRGSNKVGVYILSWKSRELCCKSALKSKKKILTDNCSHSCLRSMFLLKKVDSGVGRELTIAIATTKGFVELLLTYTKTIRYIDAVCESCKAGDYVCIWSLNKGLKSPAKAHLVSLRDSL